MAAQIWERAKLRPPLAQMMSQTTGCPSPAIASVGQEPGLTTNEACGLENLFLLLLLTAQVSKGVNDHSKDEVQHNDNDNEKEQEVVDHTGWE